MTQIKLRRDTSAAFASSNPILGNGEPAYETDTKKLKIGDGTTAYTQLEYFSAGGGGSTNITATLPLKIVDGVISLEVDGQTIQVQDGKLHANLDELGNEVNTLSGRVTTVEGEVAKKEDEITALEPITLEKKVISSLKGMLYTSDGTRLYAQSTTNIETDNNWRSPAITYNSPVSYIDIPLDINTDQVITIPRFNTSYSLNEAVTFILGSYNADGLFYPIYFQAQGNADNGYCWLISNDYPETVGTTSLRGIGVRGKGFGTIGSNTDKVYIQAKYDESSGFYIRTFGAFPGDSSTEGVQTTYTDKASIDRLRQITVCRFVNMGKMGTSSTAVPSASFGRYDGAHLERGTLPNLTNIPNSFSLTDVQSSNYLQLNIGSGLSVVDGKLTASSTAPSNMVTTDTAQTITGQKEFNHTILSLNQDLIRGQQSTSYRNGAGLSMGSNSTSTDGGVFAPQWRIYSTTGNVDRTETIITTYNQSKLNNVNFNTANKLVRLDSSGKLPAIDGSQLTNLPSGSSEPPANMVTTDTAQRITGHKSFSGELTIDKIDGNYGLYISTHPLKSAIRFGNTERDVIIAGKGITTEAGDKFLTSGNVTAYITETYVNGTSWYRIWSDGWCEQGGYNSNALATINLLKQYTDTNYTVITTILTENSSGNYYATKVSNKTTSNFMMTGNEIGSMWQTSGYVK